MEQTFILTAETHNGSSFPLPVQVFQKFKIAEMLGRQALKEKCVHNIEILDVHGELIKRIEKK